MEDLYVNSLGIKMVLVQRGTFIMGSDDEYYWDESPKHEVVISKPFYISEDLITIEQYKKFRPGYFLSDKYLPYVTGISWYEADEFCKWLSTEEGLSFRLPTEAEWEYVSGKNEIKLNNLFTNKLEWCLDWYGEYEEGSKTDPFGAKSGACKVIKGGSPDCIDGRWIPDKKGGPAHYSYLYEESQFENTALNFRRPSNRAGLPPCTGCFQNDKNNRFGMHNIGFRIVQSGIENGSLAKEKKPYVKCCVKHIKPQSKNVIDHDPVYIKRKVLPIPPENCDRATIDKAGFHPSIRGHNHSPALAACPNGDLLAVFFSSYFENEPGVSLIAVRLRYGCEEWDFPQVLIDLPGVCDSAPLLWKDNERLYLFWGNIKFDSAFPFQWIYSDDNGETWSEVKYPFFENKVGPHSKQPINSAFRVDDDTICVSSDGWDPDSLIWITRDNGSTWRDPLGRTHGRHTAFVLLKDGSILGMGGKNTNIDGYMPRSISKDLGRTWERSVTPFPALKTNQRPSLLRLKSGRLFFAGDFQDKRNNQPAGITQKGAYGALSADEGETWIIKKLKDTMKHENPQYMPGNDTIGYSVACQSDDENIHLITTMNEQSLHFEFNEAWILQDDEQGSCKISSSIVEEKEFEEFYQNGTQRCSYRGVFLENGRFMMHGNELHFHKSGKLQKNTSFHLGVKTGTEEYFDENGSKIWLWDHREDGSKIWTQYRTDTSQRSVSEWIDSKAGGRALIWDKDGSIKSDHIFRKGK